MNHLIQLVDKLYHTQALEYGEWVELISGQTQEVADYLFEKDRQVRDMHYGHRIFVRGLIEFTNYCKNDCYYCGIRCSNKNAHRYRLSQDQILACCKEGYQLGFRTFVLQGGEDLYFNDDRMVELIKAIKSQHPDCALTLSIGEKSRETYQKYYNAGADRYLLRHETANDAHYRTLHPDNFSLTNRKQCLYNFKEIGFQVGAGFMVGSPNQTVQTLAEDMLFLKALNPAMVGIGPFIPHHDTPFAQKNSGTLEQTLFMLGLIRLMIPKVLLPATTALGTIHPNGREMGMNAGANVLMPNLSPAVIRKDYMLYDNKISSGDESAQCKDNLEKRMNACGYELVTDRGDSLNR